MNRWRGISQSDCAKCYLPYAPDAWYVPESVKIGYEISFTRHFDGSIQTLPYPDLFVFMYIRKEAVLSSQIEGTQSSLRDLLEAEAKIFAPNRPKDVDEVVNYVRAMNHGIKRLADIPVSTRLLLEIHTELMQGVRGSHLTPGELRTNQNWIGPAGCLLHEASFVPPPSCALSWK